MGASSAETPTRPDASLQADAPPAGGLRASDAERDEVVARLTEEFAAGRLSHDTFMYRMNAVLEARHQADLPALLADLPATPPRPGLAARLRAAGDPVRQVMARLARASANLGRAAHPGRPAGQVQPVPLEFPRGGGVFSIGRHGSCDLAIADMTVSRAHARLARTPDGWLLTDLSSTNGTRVNGWRVRGQVRVRAGDLVSFGDAVYSLVEADAPDGC
jgi:Domain of unknown function (DUF1707)/FHA domain